MSRLRMPRPTTAQARAPALAGALVASIAGLVLAMLAWAAWAQVDEVVIAQGRVIPAGRVKLINHAHGGRVAELLVRDGQRVETGAVLLQLDGSVAASEHAEVLGRLQVEGAAVARLQAEADGTPMQVDPTLATARPDLVEAERRLLEARTAALAGRRETAAKAVQARRGDVRTAAAESSRVRNSLVLLKQQAVAVRELADRGLYPELKRVAIETEVSDQTGEVEKSDAGRQAAQAALAEAESRGASVDRDWRAELLTELSQRRAERDRLQEALRAHDAVLADLALRTPVAGIVQELAVAAAGQAVAANETLMKIVPTGAGLMVEAVVRNEDVGRLHAGMPAKVKVHAFDWLRFGSLAGALEKVAADATPDGRTGEAGYTVTVTTSDTRLGGDGFEVVPGMTVNVELEVGQRTILSYLTDRILRGREAFREG